MTPLRFATTDLVTGATGSHTPCVTLRRKRFRIDADNMDGLYREHATDLVVYFARRLLDPASAVDLAAETFVAAYAGRRGFRGDTREQATAWLYGIARNLLLAHIRDATAQNRALRRYHFERRVLTDDEVERIHELAGLDDMRTAIRRALPLLSADHQTALQLRVVNELEYREIASRLRVSEDVVRARVSRGLRALAAHAAFAGDTE